MRKKLRQNKNAEIGDGVTAATAKAPTPSNQDRAEKTLTGHPSNNIA